MKTKRTYICQECGANSTQWAGQCAQCGCWNSLCEELQARTSSKSARIGYSGSNLLEVNQLTSIDLPPNIRLNSHIPEFDRVLGGGIVPGSVVLLGGDPGIGKSTILLQVLCGLAHTFPVLYVTGEESLTQVALRAQRLGLKEHPLKLLTETQVEKICETITKYQPAVVVIDSIQTVFTEQLESAPGSVSQVRESAAHLVRYAKQTGTTIFMIGHVTKEGALAGPRVLEHMVDTVLYFEGEQDHRTRMIRAVKNRFGTVNELGIFAMTDQGLKGVSNPSAIFLSRTEQSPGSVVTVAWEGSRPLLVEVQALVDRSHLPVPRRVTIGLDSQRLTLLLAVLHRHCGIITHDQDIFVNVVGGVKLNETAADLAMLVAILSSLKNKILPPDLIVFGEMGLGGEVRPISRGQERLKEVVKHGFKQAIVPLANAPKHPPEGLHMHAIARLQELLDLV